MNRCLELIRFSLCLLFAAVTANGATLTWTNTAGGAWSNAANWSPNQTPAGADQVFITNAGSYTVTLDVNASVSSLTIGGGAGTQTLQQTGGTFNPGNGGVRPNGRLSFQGGALGGVLLIESNANFFVEGSASKTLSAVTTNRGTFQLSGTGDLTLTGSMDNEGLLNLAGDVRLWTSQSQPRPLRNPGTLRKSAGTGTAEVGVAGFYGIALTNSGTIEVQSGVISFFGGGTLDGTLNTAPGTRLDFTGGTYTQTGFGSPLVTGAGTTRLTGGLMLLHDYPPGFLFVGGTVQLLPDFQGGGGITNLVVDGGTLTGTHTVTGTLRLRSGAIGGVLLIESNANFFVEGSASKTLSAVTTNRGTFQLSGTGDLTLTGSMDNEGLLNLAGDVRLWTSQSQPRPLRNPGTLRKSAGTGTAEVGVAGFYGIALTNSGTIEVQSGVISFFGGGTLDGTLNTAPGTRLDFTGGTYTQTGFGSPLVTGAGTTRLTGGLMLLHDYPPGFLFVGGTVQLLPDFQGGGGITNLVVDGGTLTGTHTVTGTLRLRSGAIGGVLLIESNANFFVEGSASKTLSAVTTNRGTFQLSGTGDLTLTGSMDNEGLLNLAGDVRLWTSQSQPRPLRNPGTLRKSAGTGTAEVGVAGFYGIALTNSGTIEVQSGVISFFGGGTLDGTLNTAPGTRLDFTGGTYTQTGFGSPLVTGAGTTRLTGGLMLLHDYPPGFLFVGGTVQLLPDFQGGGGITNLVVDGGTLTGTHTVTGTLRLRSGAIGGVLLIESNANFFVEGSASKTLSAVTTNRGTFQLSGTGDLTLTGSMDNEGLLNLAGDVRLWTSQSQPRPLRNPGTLRKSAGTGTAEVGVAGFYGIALTNSGTIEVQSGVISFFGGGTLDGTLNTAPGTRLDFTGGTYTQTGFGSPLVTGAGTTRLTGGLMLLHDYPPGFLFVGGTVQLLPDFQGGGGITNLVVDGGTLTGTHTVTGTLRLRSGAIGGVLLIESNANFFVEGSASKTLSAVTTNRGTFQLSGTGDLTLTGSMDNEGLLNLAGDVRLWTSQSQPRPLRNPGTLRKSAGTGTAEVGVAGFYGIALTNSGTIEVQSGVISFFGGGTLDGTLNTAPGTRLDFTGGTYTQTGFGSPLVTGAGTTRLTGGLMLLHDYPPGFLFVGGTVQLLPDFQGGGGITNLVVDGGTLTGTHTVTGTLRLRSGAIGGVLLIESNANFFVEGSASKTLSAVTTNRGTFQLSGTGDLTLTGSMDNEGLLNLAGDVRLWTSQSQPRPLRNPGTLRKSAGTGTAEVGVAGFYGIALTNSGTIEAQSGVISFFGANDLSNGTLQVAIRSLSNFGRIHFSTPPVLTGTLSAYLVGNYTPALNNRFSIITFNSSTGTFTDANLPTDYIWQTGYSATDVSITVLRTALAAHWPAETNALEIVNNRTAAQSGGARYTNGIIGQAFFFDGNGCFTAPDGPEFRFGTNSFSLDFWIRPDSYTGSVPAEGIRVLQKTAAPTTWLFLDLVDSGRIEFETRDAGGQSGTTVSSGRVALGSWNHVAVVCDRAARETRYFINGALDSVLPLPAPFTNALDIAGAPLEIGSCSYNSFQGSLDELRIYTRALTAADIAARVQGSVGCTNCPAPPPVLSPAVVSVVTGLPQSFTVVGGAGPFTFSFATNNSSGTLGALNGVYVAGAVANSTDTVRVTDSRGLSGTARVNVLPAATPRPDLVVHAVSAPANAMPGVAFPVIWTITNSGPGGVVAPWQDFVLLSADTAIGNDTLLGAFTITNNLAAGGSVTVTQYVTVPVEGPAGNLRLVVATDANSAVVELSNTNNSSISATATLVPQTLNLSLDLTELREDAVNPVVNAVLRRNGSLASSLAVNIASSAPDELTAPAIVTIPAGQSSTTFTAQVLPDGVFDGPQLVNVTATAAGYLSGAASFMVLDANTPSLGLQLSVPLITEGQSFDALITRPAAASGSALTATLNASAPAQFFTPSTAVFALGQTSVLVSVLSINDSQIERSNSFAFTAQAPGYLPAAAALAVLDNDLPAVTLTLGAASVSEGAGANATSGLLTRSPAANEPLTVTLASGDTNTARVPGSVVIPAGQASVTFPIAAIDNDTADGSRSVALGGSIREPGTGQVVGEITPVVLTVTDNDGPTLTVALEAEAVGEGLNPATVGTVTRNSSTSAALTVNLASSNTNEATVPLSVVIPIGATSIVFPITSRTDGTNDGSQSVTITASAPGFTAGSAPLVVTDADFVDLVVSSIRFNTNAATSENIDVIYRIENRGTREAAGSWSQRVFFSTDALVGDDTLAAQNDFSGALGAGQFFEQSVRVKLPNQVGRVWVVVQTDHANSLAELLEGNNIVLSPEPISVMPAYSVSVAADVEVAPGGTPVHFTGVALRPNLAPAISEPVLVSLELRGTKRQFQAVTDNNGSYAITFIPLPGEGGQYHVAAGHPGDPNLLPQDQFTLLALRAGSPARLTLLEGESASSTVTVQNLADVQQSGLTATLVGGPTNVTILPSLSANIVAGDGSVTLAYAVTAPNGISGSSTFRIRIASSEGAITDLNVPLTIEARRARLVAFPGSLESGMKRGTQRFVEFAITNVGGLPTGPLQLLTPNVSWLSLASGNSIPPLGPGEGTVVSIQLTPPADLPLGPHSGTIAINASNTVLSVPYTFRSLSDAIGALRVISVDEFTYYAEGAPKVSNAVVRLTDAVTGTVLNTNTGPTGELLLPALVESYYYIDVTAEKHSSFRDLVRLEPGTTNLVTALMARQSVTYTWTVVPIQIEDRYTITVETVFETAVPKPIVTIEPNIIDLANFVGTEQQINLTLRNHGLIAAQNTKLSFPSHSRWSFTPLIGDVGVLPAQSTLVIPLTIRKLTAGAAGAPVFTAAGRDSCSLPAKIEWDTPCGDTAIHNSISLGLLSLLPGCGSLSSIGDPQSFNSDIWDGIGGGSSGNTGTTELRSTQDGDPIFHDVPYKCDPCEQARFNWVVLHCFPKLIPGESWYTFASELGGAIAGGGAFQAAAMGGRGVRDCWKNLKKEYKIGIPIGGAPDCFGNLKAAYEGKPGDAIINGLKCTQLPHCAPGGGPLMWAIECEKDLMELPECKDRGIGGFGSPSGAGFTAASAPVVTYPPDPAIPQFDSAAPLLLAGRRIEKILRPYEYFYGDRAWFNATNDLAVNEAWMTVLASAVDTNSPAGVSINAAERTLLTTGPLPIELPFVNRFLDRINRTMTYAAQGITNLAQVPAGESTDFIAMDQLVILLEAADAAQTAIEAEGFENLADSYLFALVEYLNRLSQDGGGAVCARVKVRLDQQAVLTRDAFNARLEISNDTDAALTEFSVELRVRDDQGHETTSLFQLRTPELTGLGAINGTGVVPAQSTARVSWVLVPTSEAAPFSTVRHFVSGTMRYRQNDVLVSLPLAAAPIDVLPNPKLVVKYFHERDVFSDDPFTPEVEPAIPYSLAVMVANEGFGTARQMRISSAQPQIVENDKGLLIDFEILGSQVENQPGSPSLTVNLGDIGPGTNAIARWLLRSTLQGLFIDYSATFEHIDGLGDKRLSLIDRVEIHEMMHIVSADRSFADGRPDFLVNDIPDFDDYPDTLHLSSGGTQPVVVYTEGTPSNLVTPYQPTAMLTLPPSPGWAYFRLPDPANGSTHLVSVRRADNSEVPLENFWVTDRTFIGLGLPPRREFRLHLLDFQPSGSYTLTYDSAATPTDLIPPVSRVNALPADSSADFAVTWDGSDVGRGIAAFDLFVSENNGAFTRSLTATPLKGLVFRGQPGVRYGFYTVAIDAAGNREPAPSAPDAVTLVSISNRPPALALPVSATIEEGDTLTLEAVGTDPDAPAQALSYQLLSAPAGVTLNPNSGAISWVTGEGNGPSTNLVQVRVSDNGVPSLSATATVTVVVAEVNQSPTLDSVATRIINKGILVTIPFVARDLDLPANRLTFSLGSGGPAGSGINPTNGIFTWRPGNDIPAGTNHITVSVSDNATPPRVAMQVLTLIVRNRSADFTVSVGSTNVFGGESNAVPVRLSTGVELRDLAVVLNRPGGRLDSLALGTFAPEVTSALLEPVSSNASRLRFQFAGLISASNHPLADLRFLAPTNGPSTIVRLVPTNAVATDYAGVALSRAALAPGIVVIINREPVLVGRMDPGRILRLYGRPGANYAIESKPGLTIPAPWQPWSSFPLLDGFSDIDVGTSAPFAVFRAVEVGAGVRLAAHRDTGPVFLTVTGEPGPGYRLEGASVMLPLGNWQTLTTFTLSNDNQVLTLPPTNLPMRFFRVVKP